jgi:hypothetical protein
MSTLLLIGSMILVSPANASGQDALVCSTVPHAEWGISRFGSVFTSSDPPYPEFRQEMDIRQLDVQDVPMGLVIDVETCETLRQAARQVLQQYLRGPVDLDGVRYGYYRYGPYFAVLAVLSPTAHRSPLLIFRADTLVFLGDITV